MMSLMQSNNTNGRRHNVLDLSVGSFVCLSVTNPVNTMF